jgi:hypothetical protein
MIAAIALIVLLKFLGYWLVCPKLIEYLRIKGDPVIRISATDLYIFRLSWARRVNLSEPQFAN